MENSFRKYNLVLIITTLSPLNILKPVLTHSTGGDEGKGKTYAKKQKDVQEMRFVSCTVRRQQSIKEKQNTLRQLQAETNL